MFRPVFASAMVVFLVVSASGSDRKQGLEKGEGPGRTKPVAGLRGAV